MGDKTPEKIMGSLWKALKEGGMFLQAIAALFSLFAIATVHLSALFSIVPPSIRRLIDIESIGNATIHLYGSLAVAAFFGLICTPVFVLLFAFILSREWVSRQNVCIKFLEDFLHPVSVVPIQTLMRISISLTIFLFIYLGPIRGAVMFFVSIVMLSLSVTVGLALFIANAILKSEELPDKVTNEYAYYVLARSFPVILAMFALSASWATGVYRSYHLIETSEMNRIKFDFRDELQRIIFTTTNAGIITHTSSGFDFPLVVGIGKDHIDNFEFFPFDRIEQIDSAAKKNP